MTKITLYFASLIAIVSGYFYPCSQVLAISFTLDNGVLRDNSVTNEGAFSKFTKKQENSIFAYIRDHKQPK